MPRRDSERYSMTGIVRIDGKWCSVSVRQEEFISCSMEVHSGMKTTDALFVSLDILHVKSIVAPR